MEKEEFDEKLDAFLEKNGYNSTILDNKTKLKVLRNIAMTSENDMIVLEEKFTANRRNDYVLEEDVRVSNKSFCSKEIDDYVNMIHNLEVNVHNSRYYITNVKGIIREERKENIKRRIKSLFRK